MITESIILFNLNNFVACIPYFLCLAEFIKHDDEDHEFWNQKDPVLGPGPIAFWVSDPL